MKLDLSQAALSQLLISGTIVHEASFMEIKSQLGLEVTPHFVIVLSIDRYTDLAIGQQLNWPMEIGQRLVEAIYKTIIQPFLWVWVAEGVLAVLLEHGPSKQSQHSYKELSLGIVQKIQSYVDTQGFSISAGIGSFYDNPYMLHHSYEEAKDSLVGRFFQGNRMIFHYDKQGSIKQEWKKPILHEEKIELLSRARIGDEEGAVAYLKILLERLAQSYKHNVDMFKSEAFELVMSLSRMVIDLGGNASEILTENARLIQDLYSTIRYDKFVHKQCEYWRKLTKQITNAHAFEASPVIRSAIAYIKEHHQQKILLENIAQYSFLSSHYFAHLFKKEVGISFVDFLNKIRIEKAVYFLEQTDLTIQEIAGRVGFPDANYFARKFKMIMNCSPTEYRSAKLQ